MIGFPDLHADCISDPRQILQLESPDIHHARTAIRGSIHIRGMRATTSPWNEYKKKVS